MKKTLTGIVLIGFILLFAADGVFAQQPAGKVFKWKFQSHWPAASASFKPLKDFFDTTLTKLTGGRLQVTLHPAGAIAPATAIFDSCKQGMIDGGTASPIYWMGIIPITAVASNCPMTFRAAWEGLYFHYLMGFEDMMKEAHLKHNILYYTEKIYPTAMISKKPVRTIEDFKGMKIRSSGAIMEFLKDLGAATSLIPGPEIYLALQTGVVDAVHWGAASGALTMKFPEIAKYYIQPDLAMAGTDVIVINKEAFEALPKDIQTTLDLALKERVWRRSIEYTMDEVNALEIMKKDYKVQVNTLPPEDQKKMVKVAMKQWDKAAAKDAASAKAVEMMKGYLKKLGYID